MIPTAMRPNSTGLGDGGFGDLGIWGFVLSPSASSNSISPLLNFSTASSAFPTNLNYAAAFALTNSVDRSFKIPFEPLEFLADRDCLGLARLYLGEPLVSSHLVQFILWREAENRVMIFAASGPVANLQKSRASVEQVAVQVKRKRLGQRIGPIRQGGGRRKHRRCVLARGDAKNADALLRLVIRAIPEEPDGVFVLGDSGNNLHVGSLLMAVPDRVINIVGVWAAEQHFLLEIQPIGA